MSELFWNSHYKSFNLKEPSSFSQYCLNKFLVETDTLIELGCGNGRDGLALACAVKSYFGLDSCPIALEAFKENLKLQDTNLAQKINLSSRDFTELSFDDFDIQAERIVIYSRFSLHSVTRSAANRLFHNIEKITKKPWVFLIEARTIFDPLYGQGLNVGPHEYQTDHYRRFIDPNDFLKDITSRWSLQYYELNTGFAPYLGEDPKVLRAAIVSD